MYAAGIRKIFESDDLALDLAATARAAANHKFEAFEFNGRVYLVAEEDDAKGVDIVPTPFKIADFEG